MLGLDGVGLLGALRFDERGFAGDVDDVGRGSDAERGVEDGDLSDGERDVFEDVGFKALRFNADFVAGWGEEGHLERADAIGGYNAFDTSLRAGYLDGGACDCASGLIGDYAFDGG